MFSVPPFEIIFAAFYQFWGKILIPLMLENTKLWRTKSGIYTWNWKKSVNNVILLVILESLCHVWFKILLLGGEKEERKKKKGKKIPNFSLERLSWVQYLKDPWNKFSSPGKGMEGKVTVVLYLLYIRLLVTLYIFAFVSLKASAPSNPLKSWEVYYMKCFCQQSIEIDYLCIMWWQECKANTEKGPHHTPFQKPCCDLTSFL